MGRSLLAVESRYWADLRDPVLGRGKTGDWSAEGSSGDGVLVSMRVGRWSGEGISFRERAPSDQSSVGGSGVDISALEY